jgi:hypothetical protein
MTQPKPPASLSLDLDNLWSYLKTHGDKGWQDLPSYLDDLIPRLLEVLSRRNLKVTVFIVGQDAALERNAIALRQLAREGHEVGNHSFYHEPWLHLLSKERLREEIQKTDKQISLVTDQKPIGFRGPGFSWSPILFEILSENGYLYDASTLPTFIGPFARAYYFRTSRLSPGEKEQRTALFGSLKDGFRPLEPYLWRISSKQSLLEIPVTTMPIFRTPFHLSYLLYLSRFSRQLAILYLNAALLLCRLTRTEPSFLLHPLDLLGGDLVSRLAFFPGMDLSTAEKARFFSDVITRLCRAFQVFPLGEYAQAVLRRKPLKEVKSRSSHLQAGLTP